MKNILKFILPLASILVFSCSSDSEEDLNPTEKEVIENDITYTADIKPIITNNCISCHGVPPTNGAPFSLTTFSEVSSRANNIFTRTNNGTMPPTGKLPQTNIDLISAWIDGGKKE
ncbi:c-type cytochrome [Flavobacteriaceae bacterium KMM 6897]|nr:c-type cytochrome [Flavobacteriaceae bacterium KMM 6897]MEB8345861.1 c-type cytochrome [Flavobacteriaceae bacterium KMM 6898]